MEEVKAELKTVYSTEDTKVFDKAKENLKLILLRERIKHTLAKENRSEDVKEIVEIINKSKK